MCFCGNIMNYNNVLSPCIIWLLINISSMFNALNPCISPTVCPDTRYGENCEAECNSRCSHTGGRTCDIADGRCTKGCGNNPNLWGIDWWVGDYCDIFVRK